MIPKIIPITLVTLLMIQGCSTTQNTKNESSSFSDAQISHRSFAKPNIQNRSKTNLSHRSDVQLLIKQLSPQFDETWLTTVFDHVELKPTIIDAMNRPAEKKNWGQYRPIFLTESRIQGGADFYNQHREALQRAEQTYGVAPEVIVAIIGVETSYGKNKGNWAVIDALSTLAFDYPRRASFFTSELKKFLTITQQMNRDPFSFKGSYAGAMGYPQFMPSSYLNFAVDFDNDGVKDLWDNPVDAIGSVANYLSKNGWVRGGSVALPVNVSSQNNGYLKYVQKGKITPPKTSVATLKQNGVITNVSENANVQLMKFELGSGVNEWWIGYPNFYSITRYNSSNMYALAVSQLANEIKKRI